MKKKDFILIGIVLFIAAAMSLFYYYMGKQDSNSVLITVDGKEYKTLSLYNNTKITIEGANGGTNVLVIEDGAAEIVEASCPDELCVHQKSIRLNGEVIVCLPNKVIVQIKGNKEKEFDGVAGSIVWGLKGE